jgi:creatinine amidohydrolase
MGAFFMDQMTSPEIKEELAQGRDTVVMGFGSHEQHGPHLPVGTDSFLADALSLSLAEELDAFLVPPMRLGCSEHHMAFAGTITLTKETFKAMVKEVLSSICTHGFKRIILLPTHGGNFAPLEEVVNEFSAPEGVAILAYTDLEGLVSCWKNMALKRGVTLEESGAHAGENEASAMLYLHPQMVRMDLAQPGFVGDHDEAIAKVFKGIENVHPLGVIGDPKKAEAQAGEEYMKGLARMLADWVKAQTSSQ